MSKLYIIILIAAISEKERETPKIGENKSRLVFVETVEGKNLGSISQRQP